MTMMSTNAGSCHMLTQVQLNNNGKGEEKNKARHQHIITVSARSVC